MSRFLFILFRNDKFSLKHIWWSFPGFVVGHLFHLFHQESSELGRLTSVPALSPNYLDVFMLLEFVT